MKRLIFSYTIPEQKMRQLQNILPGRNRLPQWIGLFLIGLCWPTWAKPKPEFLKPFPFSKEMDGYYLVYQNRYFGLLDSAGRWVVPCRYDDIDWFHEGMAEVVLNGKHGYINQRGEMIVPMDYVRATPYQNGEALVVTEEGDVGYLNRAGKPVMPFSRLGRPYFRGRYAKSWLLQPYIAQLRESAGEFWVAADGLTDYVPAEPITGQVFRETGLTIIFSGDNKFRRYGFADSVGHIIVPLVFEDANEAQFGWKDWIRVQKDSLYGFLDRQSGRMMIAIQYEDTQPSPHEVAWVKKHGKWGCLNRRGELIVPFRYDWVSPYAERRAIVKQGSYFGYVDEKGQLVVPLKFGGVSYYRNGQAKVYLNNHWLKIDPQGVVIDKGLRADVLQRWLMMAALLGGIVFFIAYMRRNKIRLIN